jgi:hypothetical protein
MAVASQAYQLFHFVQRLQTALTECQEGFLSGQISIEMAMKGDYSAAGSVSERR